MTRRECKHDQGTIQKMGGVICKNCRVILPAELCQRNQKRLTHQQVDRVNHWE